LRPRKFPSTVLFPFVKRRIAHSTALWIASPRTVDSPAEMSSPAPFVRLASIAIRITALEPWSGRFELGLAPAWVYPSTTTGSVISGRVAG
jgi:hypothetical protein